MRTVNKVFCVLIATALSFAAAMFFIPDEQWFAKIGVGLLGLIPLQFAGLLVDK